MRFFFFAPSAHVAMWVCISCVFLALGGVQSEWTILDRVEHMQRNTRFSLHSAARGWDSRCTWEPGLVESCCSELPVLSFQDMMSWRKSPQENCRTLTYGDASKDSKICTTTRKNWNSIAILNSGARNFKFYFENLNIVFSRISFREPKIWNRRHGKLLNHILSFWIQNLNFYWPKSEILTLYQVQRQLAYHALASIWPIGKIAVPSNVSL